MQALEVIKLITGNGDVLAQRLFFFNAMTCRYSVVKLRPRRPDCAVCGDNPTITHLIDYRQFCGSQPTDKHIRIDILEASNNLSCKEYHKLIDSGVPHVLLDVRTAEEFAICSLPASWHIPLRELQERLEEVRAKVPVGSSQDDNAVPIVVVCRRGNDSQRATKLLLENGFRNVKNVIGGLLSWNREIDPEFPVY